MKLRFGKIRSLIRTMKKERSVAAESMQKLAREIEYLDAGIAALSGKARHDVAGTVHKRRKMSASARRKIAAAQRARWAKVREKKAVKLKAPKAA